MKKLAMILAILSAPLCAENYTTVGIGPYLLLPNVGAGMVEKIDIGELDLNANASFANSFGILELKASLRIPFKEFYVGPSTHFNYVFAKDHESLTNCGVGIVIGKAFEGSFIDMSLQYDVVFSRQYPEVPALRIRYGVFY